MAHRTKISLTANFLINKLGPMIHSSEGDLNKMVTEISTPEESDENSLVFAHAPKALKLISGKRIGLLILPLQLLDKSKIDPTIQIDAISILYTSTPDWTMAEIINIAVRSTPLRPRKAQGIHPTAQIHPTAEVAEGVDIGPFAVVGEGVSIGSGCYIGAHTVVEPFVTFGNNVVLHPHVYIGQDCRIDDRVEVCPFSAIGKEGFGYAHNNLGHHRRIPHLGRVILEKDVHIGSSCTLDRGTLADTIIGEGTKIDNQCHIAHNCKIGKHSLITAQFTMAGSSEIGDHFVCGGLTTISGHIKITHGVRLAALSAVSKDITEPGEYGGYPIQPLKDYLKTRSSAVYVPELRKKVSQLFKKVFPESES